MLCASTFSTDVQLRLRILNNQVFAILSQVKERLQARLLELEPIPEMLRSTELRLQETNEKLAAEQKKNAENTKLVADLTLKVWITYSNVFCRC